MSIKKMFCSCIFFVSLATLIGCATTEESSLVKKIDDGYVYIVDYEKVNAVEYAATTANRNVEVRWINLPTKKLTQEEYENLIKQ